MRDIDTEHGPFRLHTYRDRLSHGLHFALLRGRPMPAIPTLVRVHMQNPLADALHWRRADFGPAVGEVLAAIEREGSGALVLLGDRRRQAMLERIRAQPGTIRNRCHWRAWPNGVATAPARRILADLGLGKLRCWARRAARWAWPGSGWMLSSMFKLKRQAERISIHDRPGWKELCGIERQKQIPLDSLVSRGRPKTQPFPGC